MERKSVYSAFVIGALIVGAAIGATACGPAPQSTSQPSVAPPKGYTPVPTGQLPQQTVQAIGGNYFGTLYKRTYDEYWRETIASQPYTIQITPMASGAQGTVSVNFQFSSSCQPGAPCPIGNVSFPATNLQLGFDGYMGRYGISTGPISVPKLDSTFPIAIEMLIAVPSGSQIDPTQSTIRIMACGFSQICSAPSQEVWVAEALGKR